MPGMFEILGAGQRGGGLRGLGDPADFESILGFPPAEVEKVYDLIVAGARDGIAAGAAKVQAQVKSEHGTWIKVREVAIVATPVLLATILVVLLVKD